MRPSAYANRFAKCEAWKPIFQMSKFTYENCGHFSNDVPTSLLRPEISSHIFCVFVSDRVCKSIDRFELWRANKKHRNRKDGRRFAWVNESAESTNAQHVIHKYLCVCPRAQLHSTLFQIAKAGALIWALGIIPCVLCCALCEDESFGRFEMRNVRSTANRRK